MVVSGVVWLRRSGRGKGCGVKDGQAVLDQFMMSHLV